MLTIRAYVEEDFPALCAIFLRAVKETASRDYSPAQIAAWAQVDESRWRQKFAHSQVLVAVINNQPVGFITVVNDYIDLFFVSPDYTRRGIGHALIGAVCASLPGKILSVDVSITARSSFLRQGFRVVAEQRVESRGEWFTNYRMEKRGSGKAE
ncbi:TPA: GNAT family N-acetyltransferase [Klebsiella aerogenes]|uniref:GNAT family N-acetyltransferase n=1 Tax=Klebsiella aerogenes TaxID=548 RepID=UPI000F7F6B34|nr:GNAT family N-acetyltransferase [Klebsiella aerogenes]RSW78589.1 GNAT family N-acetyltransferase [Klebsiella aerogenes]HBS6042525.1 GNAT family N-acetyltransferase [Klebsiella aerogenes]HDU4044776.1 GNAT family N-acetyltransferase [Klebsiella aerogenes]HDU4054503.1 GNAT family N-acetyltransferase [Klebsiella aerogenes]HEO1574027.1 GNAT family N-acetyltransferase [Klebsiella aerogenes]